MIMHGWSRNLVSTNFELFLEIDLCARPVIMKERANIKVMILYFWVVEDMGNVVGDVDV